VCLIYSYSSIHTIKILGPSPPQSHADNPASGAESLGFIYIYYSLDLGMSFAQKLFDDISMSVMYLHCVMWSKGDISYLFKLKVLAEVTNEGGFFAVCNHQIFGS
jgi:hypothetical protein